MSRIQCNDACALGGGGGRILRLLKVLEVEKVTEVSGVKTEDFRVSSRDKKIE